MSLFGLKLSLDLERRAAYPHQKFQGVPPGARGGASVPVDGPHIISFNLYITATSLQR